MLSAALNPVDIDLKAQVRGLLPDVVEDVDAAPLGEVDVVVVVVELDTSQLNAVPARRP